MGKSHVTLDGDRREVDVIMCRGNTMNVMAALIGDHRNIILKLRFGEGQDGVKEITTGDLIDSGNNHVIDMINANLKAKIDDMMAKGFTLPSDEDVIVEVDASLHPMEQIISVIESMGIGSDARRPIGSRLH